MEQIRKPNVLIAEDDYLVSEVIKRAINELGYVLIGKASDGAEAVKMTCELDPDVVLMDIKMPELDGLKATREIQNLCPKPVVILTAHESVELVKKASESGASSYCVKPPNVPEIERAITIAMARHNDLMELRRLNKELENAINEIKTLRGIIPICSSCKKIRDDKGYWSQIECYLQKHSKAEFSHGICPECSDKLYGGQDWYIEMKNKKSNVDR